MANKSFFKWRRMNHLLRNMNKEIQGVQNRTLRGLIEGAILIQRAADPWTPVDLGNLRASFFILTYKTGSNLAEKKEAFKGDDAWVMKAKHASTTRKVRGVLKALGSEKHPIVALGYTANYASFVHELIDPNFKKKSARPRWFYMAILTTQSAVLNKIREHAKIQ